MSENNCTICYKIICKQCGWEADEEAVLQIQCEELTACPVCGWSPGKPSIEKNLSDHERVLQFLRTQELAVISTTDLRSPYPESALIAFAHNDNLELFFQTNRHARKAQNLKQNPHIAFTIGLTIPDLVTVQYEGVVTQIVDAKAIKRCKQLFIEKKSPSADPAYLEHPDTIFFHVLPHWVGIHDYTGKKTRVFELTFSR